MKPMQLNESVNKSLKTVAFSILDPDPMTKSFFGDLPDLDP
jgi:hypothetical protein